MCYTDKTDGTVSGTKTVNYEYDIFGNVYRLTDGFTGNTTTYNYDLLGRITSINKSGKISRKVTYDAFDRINGLTLSLMGKNITSAVLYGDFGQVNSFTNTITQGTVPCVYRINRDSLFTDLFNTLINFD